MTGPIWSVGERGRLTRKTWPDDDLGLVFDAVTGDTHLLDHSAIEILQCLGQVPASSEFLGEALADRFSPTEQGQISEFIATTLLQLRDIGLVFDAPV